MTERKDRVLAEARSLLARGEYARALERASAGMAIPPVKEIEGVELTLISAILAGRCDLALRVLREVGPERGQVAEHILARLEILTGNKLLSDRGLGARGWVESYRLHGRDPVQPGRVRDVQVMAADCHCTYRLELECGACGSPAAMAVGVNLVGDWEWLCPGCLGRCIVEFEEIAGFIEGALDTGREEIRRLDRAMAELQLELNEAAFREDSRFPMLARFLHQEFVFHSSHAIVDFLLDKEARG